MSEVCGSRIASAKSSYNGKEAEKESTRNLLRPASTGSKDASNKCSCTLQPRSRSADGYLLSRPGKPVDTGSIPNQTVTSNDINRKSLGGWPSTKKPSDIGYLLIIKEEIIYRIPIILDITRIDETERDKNTKFPYLNQTNENEICVMMKTCAAKNLEAALKEHFQHCDWVTILAASPLPDQIRRGLVEPDVNAEKPTTAKRPRPTADWQVPLKKQFRPQVPSVSVSNECSTKERCNSQHLEVQPDPNSIYGGIATQGHRFQCTSSARQNSLCAMAASAKVDEVLAVQKSRAEKSSSPAGIQRKPTQETTVAQVQIKQAQNVQPLSNPSIALDRTTLNNRDQLRNPTSESQTTHDRSTPVFVSALNQPTTGLATAAGNFAPVQSRPQRPLFFNGGAVVRHLTPLYPIHTLSSVACISNLAVQQPQQQQQQQQTSGSPSQFAVRSAVVCGNCQFIPQYVAICSNQDFPMDLSVKVPLKKVPHTTSGLHNVYESPDIRVTESNGYEEGVVIDLAKPKRSKTNDTPLEPSTSEGIRPTELETNSESRWKCFLCNLDFEMEWWLQKHYRGHKHVCKLLESVGGSEALQKRIKCREINSETLINEKTGKLLLHVINRLINNNNSNNRVSSN